MSDEKQPFLIDYEFTPSADAEAQLKAAIDLIIGLILNDLEEEQKHEGESC